MSWWKTFLSDHQPQSMVVESDNICTELCGIWQILQVVKQILQIPVGNNSTSKWVCNQEVLVLYCWLDCFLYYCFQKDFKVLCSCKRWELCYLFPSSFCFSVSCICGWDRRISLLTIIQIRSVSSLEQ